MIYQCLACDSTFHETDQTRSEQRNGLCPSCGYEDLKEVKPLEVDAFGIDLETLAVAVGRYGYDSNRAAYEVSEAAIKALDPDSRKRFQEYQKQNDPCKEVE